MKHSDMPGPYFHFKRFSLKNERSAMKVNTDGVLLGAAVGLTPTEGFRVLDAGTGTGVIALMVAQRLEGKVRNFSISGIDMDTPSAEEAAENFAASPWAGSLIAENIPLQKCPGIYDLIISNPPYYDDSLSNPDGRKNLARHAVMSGSDGAAIWNDAQGQAMSYRTLTAYASQHLGEDGSLAMILPSSCEKDVLRYAASFGLFPESLLYVCASEKKPPYRIVFQMKRRPSADADGRPVKNIIKYKKSVGEYTPEYRALMKDFYLWA